ncbi:peptidase C39 family protein [Candidatus Woesearchaeota archaeon]|nr:peptidase C39 family protein [Candidatus Woesearchaeota archaeon]
MYPPMELYKQTTPYTCAAASLMMAVQHFKPTYLLTRENEFEVWHQSATLPTRGSSIYGLALVAHREGVPVRIFAEEPEYKFPGYRFKAYKKKEIEVADFSSHLLYEKVKKRGIPIAENDFTINDIKKSLSQKKVVVLRVIIGILRGTKFNKRNPHYIPIFAYENDQYTIMDPHDGKRVVPGEKLQEAFDAVKDCKRDHRMLVLG